MIDRLAASLTLLLLSATLSAQTVELPVRQWMAAGPFGDPMLKDRPVTAHPQWPGHNFVSALFHQAVYEPDTRIDLDATYQGEFTRDVTDTVHTVTWSEVSADDAGIVVHPVQAPQGLGEGGIQSPIGLTYFSTWVHAPREMSLEARFPAYGTDPGPGNWVKLGACSRVWINGQPVAMEQAHPENGWLFHPVGVQTITLRQGWNHVYAKSWSSFAGIKMGMVLIVPEADVWEMQFSATPPALPDATGRVFLPTGEPTD